MNEAASYALLFAMWAATSGYAAYYFFKRDQNRAGWAALAMAIAFGVSAAWLSGALFG